jgi:hypothetical protein
MYHHVVSTDIFSFKDHLERYNSTSAVLDEDYIGSNEVGRAQTGIFEQMRSNGLELEAQRLLNRTKPKTKANQELPTNFRLTGGKSVTFMRSFSGYSKVLLDTNDHTDYFRLHVGFLHLFGLISRLMSTFYSQFTITNNNLTRLGVLSSHLFALLVLFGQPTGCNVHAMTYAMVDQLKRFSSSTKVDEGVSLSGGVLGSLQGVEGKHWFSKLSIRMSTSGRADCWYEYLLNEGIRCCWGERNVPLPLKSQERKFSKRIPDCPTEDHLPDGYSSCSLCCMQDTTSTLRALGTPERVRSCNALLFERVVEESDIICQGCDAALWAFDEGKTFLRRLYILLLITF